MPVHGRIAARWRVSIAEQDCGERKEIVEVFDDDSLDEGAAEFVGNDLILFVGRHAGSQTSREGG